ncbi:hypothetical protein AAG570_003789 [Ranatra chinensis]|uniref:C2H2-type domain-containing protein n=1 Tax=Ranatra chinensis TaxID=642074 RepID=A0ABD0YT64_9HEMI
MKQHSGNKPYHCTVCEASFCRKPYLEVHMRTHTGERPFVCGLCDKRFTQKSSLNTHKRVHTGERPYACDICHKRFAVKSYVTSHRSVFNHHPILRCFSACICLHFSNCLLNFRWCHMSEKPLACEQCGMTFTSKGFYQAHVRAHHETNAFPCHLCGRSFMRDSYLIRHNNKVHRGHITT